MSITKTYRSLVSVDFATTISVGGEQVFIHFTGGRIHPRRINGIYRTSKPEVITALDNHPKYGIDWVCISEDKKEEPVEVKPGEMKVDDKMLVSGPTNSQQAREWLNKNKGVPFTRMKNRSEVMLMAKEQKVEFVNFLNS